MEEEENLEEGKRQMKPEIVASLSSLLSPRRLPPPNDVDDMKRKELIIKNIRKHAQGCK